MAPRKRVGRLKGASSLSTPAISNTHGFPALADEIYLEIISYIPSVPIPTPINSPSYPEIRRSRHETLLSLSQTSRSLRRFFWRYLWQHIEVREGMKIGDDGDTLEDTVHLSRDRKAIKMYATELVRQLEIVSVRNPQLAQHVNYLDVFIGEYSIDTVLAELARCLSLFPNLHTVQIDVTLGSRRSLGKIFDRTFKEYSYPQIRNVFVMFLSQSLIASCPEARRVGFTQQWVLPRSCLQLIIDNCPRLEVLEEFAEMFWRADTGKLIVDGLPNLRAITISPIVSALGDFYVIDFLQKLTHLQTIVISWKLPPIHHIPGLHHLSPRQRDEYLGRMKEGWIVRAQHILIQNQHRDNLEKILVIRDFDSERQFLIKPVESSNKV